jgi:hypothetical protein
MRPVVVMSCLVVSCDACVIAPAARHWSCPLPHFPQWPSLNAQDSLEPHYCCYHHHCVSGWRRLVVDVVVVVVGPIGIHAARRFW